MASESEIRLPRQEDTGTRLQYLSEFEGYLERRDLMEHTIKGYRGHARHFLVWLEDEGTPLNIVNDVVIQQFLDHRCQCAPPAGIGPRYKRNLKNSTLNGIRSGVIQFVHFLEQTGRTANPGESELSRQLLSGFLEQLERLGHPPGVIYCNRCAVSHFLSWLHQSRTSIAHVNREVVDRFFQHDCVCRGRYHTLSKVSASKDVGRSIRKFVKFLSAQGVIALTYDAPKKASCKKLHSFREWLRQYSDARECTIAQHERTIVSFLEDLGDDPHCYTASSIRDVLLRQCKGVSQSTASNMATSMRMYLKFLAFKGQCSSSLIGAVPKFARWQLSSLPRYISAQDVERVIASCDPETDIGIRDRAILLLLARLALRAGDVVHLRLCDIDWSNAELRVCGKSTRSAVLPLPQDVGDALLEYIEKARPRVTEEKVFMRARAPHRPFATSGSITQIVSRALMRAGVETPGLRGAHLLRHSAATALLRSGTPPDLIGALLRHETPNMIAIYAKVDVPMLKEIAQPWIGGVE